MQEAKVVNKNHKQASSIDKKVRNIFRLMELLVEEKSIKANDIVVAKKLDCSTKTLGRYLEDISLLYDNVIKVRRGKGNVYELTDVSYVFEKITTTRDDLSWLIELVEKWDSSILADLYHKTLKNEKDIILYKNSPFEELQNEREKEIFLCIKLAIKNREYKDIHYRYHEKRVHKEVMCLKLIFMEQNWYVAIVDQEEGFRFLRISFIEKVAKTSKPAYALKETKPYREFFKDIQNSMTLFNTSKKKAHILAPPNVGKYFKKGMKSFFDSQKFVKEYEDGSVEFSVEYTQAIEILPFVQKWLPNLKILSPPNLAERLRSELKAYLDA